MKIFLALLICLLGNLAVSAKETGQQIFYNLARSLTVYNPYNFMAPPVIRIGTNDRLNINFDIIGEEHRYLRFKLIHCNADWQPSRLLENEYLDSFNEFEISDYAYSYSTFVHYVNYNISLPNPEVPIIRSGNYLLQVFPENEPDNILLQCRFSVAENLAPVDGRITSRTDKGVNSEYQQLFLNVSNSAISSFNPYQDIIVTVTQNNRPETMRVITHPMRVDNGRIIYEHSPELIFEASNEYRRFETVKADYPGIHADSVRMVNGMWNVWLKTDFSRAHRQYSYDNTQHGRFKIDEYNSNDPDLGADYVLVNFSLDPGERQFGSIYVDGDFTNHQFNEQNLMKYDWKDGLYHASIPLKQGSYNYQYVVKPEKGGPATTRPIEGNKYETGNEYLVQVFLQQPGARGDRLIASESFFFP